MRLKRKFDIMTLIAFTLLITVVVINLFTIKLFSQKTLKLASISIDMNFYTILATKLTDLKHKLQIYQKMPSDKLKMEIEKDVDSLYRFINTVKEGVPSGDEKERVILLSKDISKLRGVISDKLESPDKDSYKSLLEELEDKLFKPVLEGTEDYWNNGFKKIEIAQKEVLGAKRLVVVSFVLTFVVIGIVFVLMRRIIVGGIIGPIMDINRVSCLMAGGNLDKEIKISSRDELGELANNFNLLAASLKDKIAGLKDSIQREQKVIRELTILNEFIGYISSEVEIETLFERFAERARDLLKAEHGFFVACEENECRIFGTLKDVDKSVLCKILGTDTLESVFSEEFFRINRTLELKLNGIEVKNAVAIAVKSTTGLQGLILLINKEKGFNQEDEDSLFNFAFQAFHTISLHSELTRLATTDGLTGLYNHRMFQERLTEEIMRAKRYKRKLFILMIDIDHFKKFNDTYGHQTGDEVLKTVARIIKDNTRSIDFSARYGGEEFVIILPDTDCKNALTVAERLRKAVENFPFILKDGTKTNITISIGISCYPEDSTEKDDLIKKADKALYHAKQTGRNRTVLYRDINNTDGTISTNKDKAV
jgi:diguanylate cyclase (GGDEF)-like protein